MAFLNRLNLGKLKETVEAGVKNAQEGIANFDVDAAVQGARDAAASGIAMVGDKIGEATKQPEQEESRITVRDFITVMWFLTGVDGAVSPEEEKSISAIAQELDKDYASYANELHKECDKRLRAAAADYGAQNAAKVEAEKVVADHDLGPEDAKLLCWNLLAIANSDGLDERELDFIRFITRKTEVSEAVFEELRGYSDAIIEIETMQNQLKSSNRGYAEVEPLVSEYTKRTQIIIEAAQALVTDR